MALAWGARVGVREGVLRCAGVVIYGQFGGFLYFHGDPDFTYTLTILETTSHQARGPAELKHINKRRKRN